MSWVLAALLLAEVPGVPTVAEVLNRLETLEVAEERNASTYDRVLFPHWSTVAGTCNTRETVLRRDGFDVVTDAACRSVSGTWHSPYDGGIWTKDSDVDIDHMVPLKEAWRSGAWAWTTEQRRRFANDLDGPQLWAVTDNVNQAKGDKDPAAWRPPRRDFECVYAKSWIAVKHAWTLTLQAEEKTALLDMLLTC
ncbi:HNH endonuclease [Herbidospora galbida]|uniref:HNH endonuclease n=1 Tax=Herbidospora galbida TaxID=2575442 RepID=A0A4U3MET3_9ACTN|nr:HNH endonuclease family protein [Herbidospora galbida]TKK86246.1 HNH endonuclease [Herbidospora galbida]